MRNLLLGFLSIGFAAGCEGPLITGPNVMVERELDDGTLRRCIGLDLIADHPFEPSSTQETIECGILGGTDELRVIVAYPDTIRLMDPGASANTPTVELFADGKAIPNAPKLAPYVDPTNEHGRFFAAATFMAPSITSADLRLRVGKGSSFFTDVGPFSVTAPEIEIGVSGCEDATATCEIPAGVGDAEVVLSVPKNADVTKVILTTSGVQQQRANQEVDIQTVVGERRQAVVRLPIPNDPDSAWKLEARVADLYGERTLHLIEPDIRVGVDLCDAAWQAGESCTLAAGVGRATLTISIPKGFSISRALYSTVEGTTPIVSEQPVQLEVPNGDRMQGVVGLDVPDRPGDVWSVTVRVGARVETRSIILEGSPVELSVEGCTSSCMLPAGIGHARVMVRAPRESRASNAEVMTWVDGIKGAGAGAVALSPDGSARSGSAMVPVPDRPGASWTIVGRVGQSVSEPIEIELQPPAPLRLRILDAPLGPEEIDFESSATPARARHELSSCPEELYVAVHAPVPPASREVEIRASLGTFNGANPRTVMLDGTGFARVPWMVPRDAGAMRGLEVSVSAEGLPEARAAIDLAAVVAEAAQFLETSVEIGVGSNGTGSVRPIVGQLIPPAGSRFSEGTLVELRTDARSSTTAASCPNPLSPTLLDCGENGTGGCLLTPSRFLPVDTEGRFHFEVPGGLCFTGELDLTAVFRTYAEPPGEPCLGKRQQSSADEPVATARIKLSATLP